MAPLSCALCGPASLHASGGRIPEHECSAERRGFGTADVDVYVICQCCRAVITLECIDRVVAGAGPPPNAACTEHDPHELWEIALACSLSSRSNGGARKGAVSATWLMAKSTGKRPPFFFGAGPVCHVAVCVRI